MDAEQMFSGATTTRQQSGAGASANEEFHVEMMYESLSFNDMVDKANAVVVGKIISISPTVWNQDSGAYWYEPKAGFELPLHHIEVEVVEPIVNTVNLDQFVEVTVIGESAVIDEKGNLLDQGESIHNLLVGQQVVLFAQQTEIAWRGGARPALILMGVPSDAYFRLEADGLYHGNLIKEPLSLAELLSRIAAERATPPAP